MQATKSENTNMNEVQLTPIPKPTKGNLHLRFLRNYPLPSVAHDWLRAIIGIFWTIILHHVNTYHSFNDCNKTYVYGLVNSNSYFLVTASSLHSSQSFSAVVPSPTKWLHWYFAWWLIFLPNVVRLCWQSCHTSAFNFREKTNCIFRLTSLALAAAKHFLPHDFSMAVVVRRCFQGSQGLPLYWVQD